VARNVFEKIYKYKENPTNLNHVYIESRVNMNRVYISDKLYIFFSFLVHSQHNVIIIVHIGENSISL